MRPPGQDAWQKTAAQAPPPSLPSAVRRRLDHDGGQLDHDSGIVEQSRATTMTNARAMVLLAALCFATTGTAQALGPDTTSPVGVGAARILVGGAILAAV